LHKKCGIFPQNTQSKALHLAQPELISREIALDRP